MSTSHSVHVSRNIPEKEMKEVVSLAMGQMGRVRFELGDDAANPQFFIGDFIMTDKVLCQWLYSLNSLIQCDINVTPDQSTEPLEEEKSTGLRISEPDVPDSDEDTESGSEQERAATLYLIDFSDESVLHLQESTSNSFTNAVGFGLVELSEWMFRTKKGRGLLKTRILNTISHVPNPREYVEGVLAGTGKKMLESLKEEEEN